MTVDPSNNFAIKFADAVRLEAAQTKSRLRDGVITVSMQDSAEYAYETLGSTKATERTSSFAPTTFSDIEHGRRQIKAKEYVVTLPIDRKDDLDMVLDLERPYVKRVVEALNKKMDQVISDAAFADINTGRNFGTSVSFAADGGSTINATATGLTYEVIQDIKSSFIDDEVGNDEDLMYWMTITGDEHKDLMSEVELTSGDFTREYNVEGGTITKACGIKLIKFGHVAGSTDNVVNENAAGTEKELICSTNRGIVVGLQKDISIEVATRYDLNGTKQIQAYMSMGATRGEGAHVKKIRVNV